MQYISCINRTTRYQYTRIHKEARRKKEVPSRTSFKGRGYKSTNEKQNEVLIVLQGEQKLAVDKLRVWFNNPDIGRQYFTLFGAAGTGKSFTLSVFMEQLQINKNSVMFGTLSGKAALVLRQRGVEQAMTIHSLIYRAIPYTKPNGEQCVSFTKKDASDIPEHIKLIVIDECSMIDNNMVKDILSFNRRVIFVGDKYQLKPIFGVNTLMADVPDAELTEPRRQALDNSILQVATDIRMGKYINTRGMIGKNVLRVDTDYIKKNLHLLNSSDQVICGLNNTRKVLNTAIRNLNTGIVFDPTDYNLPVNGDKVICTKNNHDVGLINGQIGYISGVDVRPLQKLTRFSFNDGYNPTYNNISVATELFTSNTIPDNVAKVNADLITYLKTHASGVVIPDNIESFEYGYAITCHKSQGSEFDKLIVFEEPAGGNSYLNWMYTAVTRAKQFLIIVECK